MRHQHNIMKRKSFCILLQISVIQAEIVSLNKKLEHQVDDTIYKFLFGKSFDTFYLQLMIFSKLKNSASFFFHLSIF